MAKPIKQIGKNTEANVILMPGNSGADGPLVAYKTQDSTGVPCIVSCWQLSWRERMQVLVGGRVWLDVLGHSHPPVMITAKSPFEEVQG